jgi:hypothetical protein
MGCEDIAPHTLDLGSSQRQAQAALLSGKDPFLLVG